jgi:hypothetical protein
MTFNRKLPHNRSQTTNKKLGPAHLMLKTLKANMYSERFGYAVFNYDDIMRRYELFADQWKQASRPELYFVTMDIEKCYDSVDSRKLCEFLRGTALLDREYRVLACLTLRRRNNVLGERDRQAREPIRNHFRHRFQKLCVEAGQCRSLKEVLGEENDFNFKRSLLVEYEARRRLLKSEALQGGSLEHIIQNNYITFNKKQYRQTKGIPQGMCVSGILSSFFYACLEEQAIGFLRRTTNPADGSPELNCVMRLTDDYLLITNSKANAMLFIERLVAMAARNKFRFNMSKLRANFEVNVGRIGASIEAARLEAKAAALAAKGERPDISVRKAAAAAAAQAQQALEKHLVPEGAMFNWIGISIDTKTLGLVPGAPVKKEAVLCTLNTNMQTRQSVAWLKKKLKSFLMNNVSFYFRETITSKKYATETLEKLYLGAAEKYVACCQDFRRFHSGGGTLPRATRESLDLVLARVVYVVIRSYFKYLVCNVRDTVFERSGYNEFFVFSLKFFTDCFASYKGEFSRVHRILRAKQAQVATEQQEFYID